MISWKDFRNKITFKFIITLLGIFFLGILGVVVTCLLVIFSDLPEIASIQDYNPLLVSTVFDRNGTKIGEFSRNEKRTLVDYQDIPKIVVQAFVAAEDASFFQHDGVDLTAIGRAFVTNLEAGRKVQGGSTITQQIAKILLLSRKKTYLRKAKEIFLAYRIEEHLSKEDILYLYLNQIYLGQGAYGVAKACEFYFKKPLLEITLAEAALLAGLPPAPSSYNPVKRPMVAKKRQIYVLHRMRDENYISAKQAQKTIHQPLQIFTKRNEVQSAGHYLETVRQILVKHIGEGPLLNQGLKIYTSLDLEKQKEALKQVQSHLRQLDKRQGFRGAQLNLKTQEEIQDFLLRSRNQLIDKSQSYQWLQADGTFPPKGPLNLTGKDTEGNNLPLIPNYLSIDQIVEGVVTKVDDHWGLVYVSFAESQGLIDKDTMLWARKPNPNTRWIYNKIKNPSQALRVGDVIHIRLKAQKFHSQRIDKVLKDLKRQSKKYQRPEKLPDFHLFANVELEQQPIAEASLISIHQSTSDIVSMVGGYDFKKSKFNRAYQARRQTGSSFKTFIYAAALDHNYTPATPIMDAPIIFEEKEQMEETPVENLQGDVPIKKWTPMNHSNKFMGDILLRNALIRSLNVPTIKIIEQIGISISIDYAQRLGISSPLNEDYTLALGSSAVTLYEMTKAFSHIANLGKRIRPLIIHKVVDMHGNILIEGLSLDDRFEEDMQEIDEKFAKLRQEYLSQKKVTLNDGTSDDLEPSPFFFGDDLDQLIKPSTAYLITSLLRGAIEEPQGTGRKARTLGRPAAGKTGSSSGYVDGWFIGYTPDITTGVWVGHDEERSLGKGEVGGNNALLIWLAYMKFVHKDLPIRNFKIPEGIVFANIDNQTGKLASSHSEMIVKQAFLEGTEPASDQSGKGNEGELDFLKEDFSE